MTTDETLWDLEERFWTHPRCLNQHYADCLGRLTDMHQPYTAFQGMP
ncbi:hypothetical protein [Antarcticimicrobium luteum]|nr:hypothetical protein [Antarcticimicrobium luteum]